jgi:hypothetical protein
LVDVAVNSLPGQYKETAYEWSEILAQPAGKPASGGRSARMDDIAALLSVYDEP